MRHRYGNLLALALLVGIVAASVAVAYLRAG